MSADTEKPKAEYAPLSVSKESNRTPPFFKLCYWAVLSIKNPDNLPHYLIAVFTLGLAVFASFAWIESKHGTQALELQLKAMQAEQRPWVGADPIIVGKLTYGENGLNITLDLRLKNFGKSPAIRTTQAGELSFIRTNAGLLKTQERVCNAASSGPSYVVFPGNQPISQWAGFGGGKDEVAKAKAATDFPDWIINPVIVGCIRYFSSGDNSPHETGYMYDLMHVPPFGLLEPRKGDTPANELLLVQEVFGNWAN